MSKIFFKKDDFKKDDYVSKFLLAAYEGNLDFIEFCILQGFSPNTINDKGVNPLMVSSFKGKLNVVKYLLNSRADVNVRDNEGNSVLDYAEAGENETIINLIKSHILEE